MHKNNLSDFEMDDIPKYKHTIRGTIESFFSLHSMSNNRLSDLSLIAIERDISIDYAKIIDEFASKRKNSRIILK